MSVETVEACRAEALAGSAGMIQNYVPVRPADLARMAAVHRVDTVLQATFKLAYARADALDEGEHDLLAHAYARSEAFRVCSPDKAAIRAAVTLGFGDQLVSLEELVAEVGGRPRHALREQFMSRWLVSFRSRVRLESL